MSKDTDNNLFIVSSVPRFYQLLFSELGSYETLGNRIIRQIKAAHAFRRVEQVRELSRILINIPVREYQLIAQYYLVWCECRELKFHDRVLENIIEQTQTYKAKALMSRAAFETYKSKTENALYFYAESLKANPTVSDYIVAVKGIATVKSMEGYHAAALKDIEHLIPLLRHTEPLTCFELFNSYAVELGETGRREEAQNVCQRILTSPFAPAYPECQDTARGLGLIDCKGLRSYVSLRAMPEPQVKTKTKSEETKKANPKSETNTGSVVPFPQLKEAPEPQKPDRLKPQEWSELDLNQKKELIMTAIRAGTFSPLDYDRLMVMVGLLAAGPADKVLDLEDEETLRDIAIVWAHQLEPEEMAAVLSVIRDCENDKRRNNIIDRMIRIAFEETQLCGLTEEAWRLQVERRLPKK